MKTNKLKPFIILLLCISSLCAKAQWLTKPSLSLGTEVLFPLHNTNNGYAFAANSFAQSDDAGKFSIGINPGLPVGSISDISSFAIGGDLKFSKPVAENFDLSLSAGYDVL
jgi:hypothetical protein